MSYPDGTLNLAALQDAIYDWVKKATEGVVEPEAIIWRDQSKMLPLRPMISLKIIDGPRAVARDPSTFEAPNKKFTAGVQEVLTLSIQAFGNPAVTRPVAAQLAIDLHSSLMKSQVRIPLSKAGLSVQDNGAPRNLTALEETEYEDRWVFDVQFGAAQNVLDDPSTIETVNVQGSVGDTEVDFTATV